MLSSLSPSGFLRFSATVPMLLLLVFAVPMTFWFAIRKQARRRFPLCVSCTRCQRDDDDFASVIEGAKTGKRGRPQVVCLP